MTTPGPRERLIGSTIALMRRHGVAGTGISELLEHSNTARRSIYMHFPRGKEQLVEESTRAAGTFIREVIATAAELDDPADGVSAMIEIWKDILLASDFTEGCPVVAAALAGAEVPSAPTIAATAFRDWEALISAQLARAGLKSSTAASLATMAVASVEGATILAMSGKSVSPLERTQTHLIELIESHLHRDG